MFIIWGNRPSSKVLGNTKRTFHCPHCNNDTVFQVVSNKEWFTMYFIPVLPLTIEHRFECPICGRGIVVDRKKAMEILQTN